MMRKRIEQGTAHHDWLALPQEIIDTPPKELPPCMICGSPTERITVDHSMGPYPNGLIVTVAELPAYRCLGTSEFCSTIPVEERSVSLSNMAIHEMLSLVCELLDGEGDMRGTQIVDSALRAGGKVEDMLW